jgi:hypothetical protein
VQTCFEKGSGQRRHEMEWKRGGGILLVRPESRKRTQQRWSER